MHNQQKQTIFLYHLEGFMGFGLSIPPPLLANEIRKWVLTGSPREIFIYQDSFFVDAQLTLSTSD